MDFMKKVYKKILIFVSIIMFLIVFLYCQNNVIEISEYNLKFQNLPKSFAGLKILQISDLHSKSFGENQKKLTTKIRKINPDIIVFTGDMVDRRRYDEKPILDLIGNLHKDFRLYYVTGNHEAWSGKWVNLKNKLSDYNIEILENTNVKYFNKDKDDYIYVSGINDPGFNYNNEFKAVEDEIALIRNKQEKDKFSILLSHRPETFDLYVKYNIDLVFSGHAHGGQVRVPFIGGLVAPNQGFNPKYYGGKYSKGNTSMILSRGLGNSIIPQRLFNRPELVVVVLN
jgi:uncharacterized protein